MSEAAVIRDQSTTRMRRIKDRLARVNRLFLAVVVAPTILATIYFGLIASDVYVSESRFVVRSPQRQAPSGIGALLQGAGFARAQDDTYSVHAFMLSRDALRKLNDNLALGKSFGSSDVDAFSRFNAFGLDGSFEALYRYYRKRVAIDLDSVSNISVLQVNAFTAEDAYRANEMLLEMGERLINQLNERGRQDMIRFASSEVAAAETKVKEASLALSQYRTQNTVFDPERQSALQLQQISKLQDELVATKTLLAQVRTLTPDNPQIPALRKRVETLQSEMDSEMYKVAGNQTSLTNKSSAYERLVLDRSFAEKQLAASLASLEQARNDAQRKLLYLEHIVQPNKPDVAVEPHRLRAVLTTLVLGLIAMGLISMLIAGIREHKD